MQDTFYSVLGLDPRASPDQVERAYRFSIKLYEEDSLAITSMLEPTEAELQRHRVREAYEVLSDPEKRRAYDEGLGSLPHDSPDLPSPESDFPLFPPDRGIAVTFSDEASVAAEIAEPRLAALLSPDSRAFESLPVLEEKANAHSRGDGRLRTAALTAQPVSEEFRMLRAKVAAIGAQRPFRCVAIVSGVAGEGKTTIALGLATAMAREPNSRVLLLEADLRRPSLDAYLGLPQVPGLGQFLCGAEGPVGLRRVVPAGFFLLSAGRPSDGWSPELLGSKRMAGLLGAARNSFDLVLIDCPPLLPLADSAILQDLVDGFLAVVRERHGPRETILRALGRLKPDRIQGVIVNDHREIVPSHYNEYNYFGPPR